MKNKLLSISISIVMLFAFARQFCYVPPLDGVTQPVGGTTQKLRPLAVGEDRGDEIVGVADFGESGPRIEITRRAWEDLQTFALSEFHTIVRDITSWGRLQNRTLPDGRIVVAIVITHPFFEPSYVEIVVDPSHDYKVVGKKRVTEGKEMPIDEKEIEVTSINETTRQISIIPYDITTVITFTTKPEPNLLSIEQERISVFENSALGIMRRPLDRVTRDWKLVGVVYPDPTKVFRVDTTATQEATSFLDSFSDILEGLSDQHAYLIMKENGQIFLVLKDPYSKTIKEIPSFLVWNSLSELISDEDVARLFGPGFVKERNKISDVAILSHLKNGEIINIQRSNYWEAYSLNTGTATGRPLLERARTDHLREKIIHLHIHPMSWRGAEADLLSVLQWVRGNIQNETDKSFISKIMIDSTSVPSEEDIAILQEEGDGIMGIIYHRFVLNPANPHSYIIDRDKANLMLYRAPTSAKDWSRWRGRIRAFGNSVRDRVGDLRQVGYMLSCLKRWMEINDKYRSGVLVVKMQLGTELLNLVVKPPEPKLNGIRNDSIEIDSTILRPRAAIDRIPCLEIS